MLKGQKAVSLCWVRPAMEKELMKEMDGAILGPFNAAIFRARGIDGSKEYE